MAEKINREKIFLNGYGMYLDRERSILFPEENSKHGLPFDVMDGGDHIWVSCRYMTENEKKQLVNYLKNKS